MRWPGSSIISRDIKHTDVDESEGADSSQSSSLDLIVLNHSDHDTRGEISASAEESGIEQIQSPPSFYVGEKPLGRSAAEALGASTDPEPLEGEIIAGTTLSMLLNRRDLQVVLLILALLGGWKLIQSSSDQSSITPAQISSTRPSKINLKM